MKKLLLLAAVAVGYVLGARAGRARYEQIKNQAQRVWHTEPVQNTVDTVTETAKAAAADVAHKAADSAKEAATAVKDKVTGSDSDAEEIDLTETITPEAVAEVDPIVPDETQN